MFGRPLDSNEPTPRDDLVALNKLLAEVTPMEMQVGLGWKMDTRRFIMSLPDDKHAS